MNTSLSRNKEICERIAAEVKEAGGRVFYVGGYVRDRMLAHENKDLDIEVHGIEPEKLYAILEKIAPVKSVGSSFGVYMLYGYDIDIAMPRKETATGRGHRDFEITVDPFIGYEQAARRRDFTINAMMEDVLSGEIVDPFKGMEDLNRGILRCVDPATFIEDPLRVLRGAQFASRFGFRIEADTLNLCRTIDLSTLPKERIEEELRKALVKGRKPSVFFEVLREMDQLDVWFKEVKQLIGVRQDPIYHPEGDVWTHTMEVLDRAAYYRDKVSDPFYFELLALCHDFGKILVTQEINGRIHAYDHENQGLPLIRSFLIRLSNENDLIRYVTNMTSLHMKPNAAAHDKAAIKTTNRIFDQAVEPLDLIYFSMADRPVIMGDDMFPDSSAFLFERYGIYQEMMSRPYVTGKDLIDAGLQPDESFTEILEYAHKLRLAGVNKESALKQTLAQFKVKRDKI
ncbi:MAG: HD domain-containing protein [Erysipelotrichaceae bacterium]|nr:HD domain-containing protein [Erysipelotrichaceae bacterium]